MTYGELSESQARRSRQFAEAQTNAMSVYCDAERYLKELQAENAKLRELVQHLYEYRQLYFKTGIYPTDHGVTERRMRELGVEVE